MEAKPTEEYTPFRTAACPCFVERAKPREHLNVSIKKLVAAQVGLDVSMAKHRKKARSACRSVHSNTGNRTNYHKLVDPSRIIRLQACSHH